MFMRLKAAAVCRTFAKEDARRDAGLTIPEDVELLEAIAYGEQPMHTLDISRPRGVSGALPLIVNVHGGGYVYGSTLPYRYYCASLAQRGFAVVSFNYRLAPKYKFPAPLQDLNAVMDWCLRHAGEYGFDTENIFMVGDSAGAQIASQYAAIVTTPDYAAIMGITPPKALRLSALGLNCGMYDLPRFLRSKAGAVAIMDCYFGKNPEVHGEKLDVLRFIGPDYPPCYLISSPGDFLLDCCVPMWETLRSRGVEAQYKLYGNKRTRHVFHVNIRRPLAAEANDDETAFFRSFLR